MQIPKFLKISLLVILFMAVAAYIVYAFVGMKSTNPDEVCQEVTYIFEEEGPDVIVDSTSATNMLLEKDIYPKGKKMSDIDLKQIQMTLSQNPFVVSVDCYGNNNGMEVGTSRLCVKIKQMVPLLLVFDNKNGQFYADERGNIVQADSMYAKNLLVANGEINGNYVKELVPLAMYIKNDDFWNSQIEQVFVEYDKKKNRVVTLIPRVGEQKIFMGTLDNYDKKLVRLKKFYERGLSVVGWNKYSVINLEYENQVVGIVKGMEKKVEVPDEEEELSEEALSDTDEAKSEEAKPSEKKADEAKKDEPKKKDEVKKEDTKKKEEARKEEPNKKEEAKKEVPKKKDEVKKEEPQKAETKKKEEPKKKEESKKKEEPKKK